MSSRSSRGLRRYLAVPVIAASLLFSGAIPASGQSPAAASVAVTASTVALTWPADPEATAYLIVDDRSHEVRWRGQDTTARLPVQAPTSVSLLVVAVTDQGPRTVAKALATVPDGHSGLTPLTAVTTSAGTALGWGAIPDVDRYTVTAGGRELTQTTDTQLRADAVLGQHGTYQIAAERAGTDVPQSPVRRYSYGVEVSPATTDVEQTPSDAQPGDTLPAGIPTLTMSRTTYETYIPPAYLDAPDDGIRCESGDGSDYWFAGDGRGTGYETGKYRTKAASNHYWTSAWTFTSKGISPTKRYKKSGGTFLYDSQRTAGGTDFTIRPLQNDGRYARTVIDHEVGNPYCASIADISYANQQDLYQNGSHWIYGTHDKMPNHQFYRHDQYSDGTYARKLVFDHPLVAPECLAGVFGFCSAQHYQYTR